MLVKVDKLFFPADFIVLDMEEDENLPIILGRPFLTTRRMVIDVYKGELIMRVEDQVISSNIFKEVDSLSNIDDYYRVYLVKENIEDNSLKEALLIIYKAFIVHPVDIKAKKAQGNINVMETPQHSSNSNFLIKVMEPSLSSPINHKPYKKEIRKWGTKKKRYGDYHFEPRPKDALGTSRLKLFSSKRKSR
ncbi:hypothetical protein PanWU01x14_217900 [Parasponia andersonii]|uniref:Uncharacterized protein n=1 Tax=Parasponia andersonii TaxID=3476 RepID=A0A2P5BQZ4_PARAD|nr:hypothetical protein PanWU01x14_217900 [Parasponia andersonii]